MERVTFRANFGLVSKLAFLAHQRSNLLLWTLQESVNLALPLVLDRVVAPLNPRVLDRVVTLSTIVSTSSNHSGLRAGRALARSSHLSSVAFLLVLHIAALNIFNFVILVSVALVLNIETALFVPPVVVAFSPLFCRQWVQHVLVSVRAPAANL